MFGSNGVNECHGENDYCAARLDPMKSLQMSLAAAQFFNIIEPIIAAPLQERKFQVLPEPAINPRLSGKGFCASLWLSVKTLT